MLRLPLALLACLLLPLGVAQAGDAWDELVRKVDRADPEAVHAARLDLEAQHPDFWRLVQRRGGLLAAMAHDLSPAELEREWQRAERDPEQQEALVHNLHARPDLATRLLTSPWFETLALRRSKALRELALERVVHGDAALARRLLASAESQHELAEELADLPHAAGPTLLAEALLGSLPLSAPRRAALADVRPDLENRWLTRRLQARHVNDLAVLAVHDADPGLRVLAARLLHACCDPAAAPRLVAAYQGALSHRIDRDEWQLLGKHYGCLVGIERLGCAERHDLLFGWLVRDHVRAGSDPDGAGAQAEEVLALWARLSTAEQQAHLIRCLDMWGYVFVDSALAQPWGAPAWLALLERWQALSKDLAQPLAPLLTGVVARAHEALRLPGERVTARSEPWRLGRSHEERAEAARAHAALVAPGAVEREAATLLLAGLAGSRGARAALADLEEHGPSVRLEPEGDGDAPRPRVLLTPDTRAALGLLLRDEPDPWLVDLAANRLGLAGTPEDVALLTRHAARLGVTDVRSRHALASVDVLEADAGVLETLLDFVASPPAPPAASVEVFESVLDQVLGALDEDAAPRAQADWQRILSWLEVQGPRLDPDRAEGVLGVAWTEGIRADDAPRRALRELARSQVSHVAVEGVRLRLLARMTPRAAPR